MKSFRTVMKDVVNSIDTTLYIDRVLPVIVGSTITHYILYTCDTLHLRIGSRVVTWGGSPFIISDIVLNEYVTIVATAIIEEPYPKTATTWPIHFFSGKISDTANEMNDFAQVNNDKTPFLWIREPFETFIEDEFSAIREYDLQMYLLDVAVQVMEHDMPTNKVWFTEDHHKNVIEPMDNLWRKRILPRLEKEYKYFVEWRNERVRPHSLVGQQTEKGSKENLFDKKLSGVEVRLELDINVLNCCE